MFVRSFAGPGRQRPRLNGASSDRDAQCGASRPLPAGARLALRAGLIALTELHFVEKSLLHDARRIRRRSPSSMHGCRQSARCDRGSPAARHCGAERVLGVPVAGLSDRFVDARNAHGMSSRQSVAASWPSAATIMRVAVGRPFADACVDDFDRPAARSARGRAVLRGRNRRRRAALIARTSSRRPARSPRWRRRSIASGCADALGVEHAAAQLRYARTVIGPAQREVARTGSRR